MALLAMLLAALAACSNEARTIGPSVPQTPPDGDGDPRIPAYQDNLYQVSQGGRYFAWYGCGQCHGTGADGVPDLAGGRWRHGGGFGQIYASILKRHPAQDFQKRVPTEQLWQITAYVRDLPAHSPEKRRRVMVDRTAEAQGSRWQGPQ